MDSGCSYTIVMGILVVKLNLDMDYLMQWHMQAENITNNLNIKVDFTLTALSATNVVTWDCHVDDSAKDSYDIILGQDL